MDLRFCTKAALLPLKTAFMRCFDVFMPFFYPFTDNRKIHLFLFSIFERNDL